MYAEEMKVKWYKLQDLIYKTAEKNEKEINEPRVATIAKVKQSAVVYHARQRYHSLCAENVCWDPDWCSSQPSLELLEELELTQRPTAGQRAESGRLWSTGP